MATFADFNRALLKVGKPTKSTGEFDFLLAKINYGTEQSFTIMENETTTSTKITENKKKPGQLTQGFHLENPETLKMLQAADEKILEELFAMKDLPDMPSWLASSNSMEELKRAISYIKYKPLVHMTKKKGPDGKATKAIDPNGVKLIYGNMIQCGPKHKDTPNLVYSKYLQAAVLSPEVREAIKSGAAKEADFLLPVQKMVNKFAMKVKWVIVVGDIYMTDTNLKIRRSIQRVYVISFETSEDRNQKKIAEMAAAKGETFAPLVLPDFDAPLEEESPNPDEIKGLPALERMPEANKNPIPLPQNGDVKIKIIE